MEIQQLNRLNGSMREIWCNFLTAVGLEADDAVEQTVLVWDSDELIATGSRQGNLLKCIAVLPSRQGEGLLSTVLSVLRQDAFRAGHRHLFLYTKPENADMFAPLFFYPVAQTERVLLMEDQKYGIRNFVESLHPVKHEGCVGAVVMNCNPFTLGHQYLISKAAENCDHLYVFVLSEDQSFFTANNRMEMVKLGTSHIPNVTVLPTGPYLISSATFPTYFLKNRDNAPQIQCELDIQIFVRYFAPAFSITRRFVGTEPFSPLTNQYNDALKKVLPNYNISVEELPRLECEGTPISASAVRAALNDGDWDTVRRFVPETTFQHLQNL